MTSEAAARKYLRTHAACNSYGSTPSSFHHPLSRIYTVVAYYGYGHDVVNRQCTIGRAALGKKRQIALKGYF